MSFDEEHSLKSRAQVVELARMHDKTLSAGDFQSNRLVIVRHGDGTQLLFRNAFLLKHEDWTIVFSEHNGFHCYAIDTMDEVAQFEKSSEIGTL